MKNCAFYYPAFHTCQNGNFQEIPRGLYIFYLYQVGDYIYGTLQVVNVPSYVVRLDSQKHIDFSLNSPLGGGRPGRVKRKNAKKGTGGGGDGDSD